MTSIDLLVVHDAVANHIPSPSCVGQVSTEVRSACEHGYRYVDGLNRELVSLPFLMAVDDVRVVVSKDLETILVHVLGVVFNGLDGGAVR